MSKLREIIALILFYSKYGIGRPDRRTKALQTSEKQNKTKILTNATQNQNLPKKTKFFIIQRDHEK